MEQKRRYPLGIQTFSEIREGNYLYVDKTDLIYELVKRNKYVFLSRPRRFGKSLLISTLKSYFEGRKDLFEGLAIENLEKDWKKYPVLHFDMSDGKDCDAESLERYLNSIVSEYEREYGLEPTCKDAGLRFSELIHNIYKKTGQRVVVLIDEYDAPLLDIMFRSNQLEEMGRIMEDFYITLKSSDPYLRFVLLSGITRQTSMSIFSGFNNLHHITMSDDYSTLCGVTKEELLKYFDIEIETLAQKNEITKEEAIAKLSDNYGGYHLTNNCPELFNPFSLLNSLDGKDFNNYWYASGVTTYLIDMLKQEKINFSDIPEVSPQVEEGFNVSIDRYPRCGIVPMLWQTGYMSIKSHDKYSDIYRIGYPNKETKESLEVLLRGI